MKTSYGKLVNGAIIHAPTTLDTPSGVIVNPKRLSYLQAGWKHLDLKSPADPPEGKEYALTGYIETASDIRAEWKLVDCMIRATHRHGSLPPSSQSCPPSRWLGCGSSSNGSTPSSTEARLGYVLLPAQKAVMIHDTDYTPEPKTEAEQKAMSDKVQSIMEKVFGNPLPREVNVFVDPNAGARGHKCYCTAATYMVAVDELAA